MVLSNGALLGLVKQLHNTNISRSSDEVMRLHALSGLCCELDRSGGKQVLDAIIGQSMPTLHIVQTLALVCTTGTKDIVISAACAVLSRLLPYASSAAVIEIGTSLTYIDHDDCIKLGLFAMCAVANSSNTGNILMPRTVMLRKEEQLFHTADTLRARLVLLGSAMMKEHNGTDGMSN